MNTEAGFTLLEVIVAMVILGISFSVLAQGFLQINDSLSSGRDYTYMASWATSKLNEINSGVELNRHGTFEYRGQRCKWVVTQKYISQDLLRLKLKVTWPGTKGQQQYSLSRLVLR